MNATELMSEEDGPRVHWTRQKFRHKMDADQCQLYLELSDQLTKSEKMWMERNFKCGYSCQLTAKIFEREFLGPKRFFYGLKVRNLATKSDGYGEDFNANMRRKGSLFRLGHSKIRDVLGELAGMACP